MKPTRGLLKPWSGTAREGRTALLALIVLMAVLSSLLFYQRVGLPGRTPAKPDVAGGTPGRTAQRADVAGRSSSPESTAPNPDVAAAGPEVPATTGKSLLALLHPIGGNPKVMQAFGYGYSDLYQYWAQHSGIDYAAIPGEAVLAAADGKVAERDENALEGQVIVLDHGQGLQTRYAGVSGILVSPGDSVVAGRPIAVVGQPGPESRGQEPYLHFEVRLKGDPMDPQIYFAR